MIPNLISVIIPVYQVKPDEFERCISSCRMQTYPQVEILVVMNGTSVELQQQIEVWQREDSRIRVFRNEQTGVSQARNTGIDRANGEWLVFVDADDAIDSHFCETMRKKATEYSSDFVVCSVIKQLKNGTERIEMASEPGEVSDDAFLQQLLNVQRGVGFAHSKMWRAEFVRRSGIRFDETLSMAEDAHFCLQAMRFRPRICLIPDALYFYNCANASAVRSFHPNYAERYYASMQAIVQELSTSGLHYHEQDLSNFIMYHVLLICINYCFNDANGKHYPEQKQMLREELQKPFFENAVRYADYRCLSITRKAALFCLKHRLFLCLKLIAIIRHKQKES